MPIFLDDYNEIEIDILIEHCIKERDKYQEIVDTFTKTINDLSEYKNKKF